MTSNGIFRAFAAIAVLVPIISFTGCQESSTSDVKLVFNKDDISTYKITTLSQRQVIFEGDSRKEKDFKGGTNITEVEMIFDQQIVSADKDKNAAAKITIKELKYKVVHKDKEILNFDSTDKTGKDNPMSKLVGQSYMIGIAPNGKITDVVVPPKTLALFKGNTPSQRAAVKLLTPDAIKERHCIAELPDKKERSAKEWSRLKDFSFGLMGEKSYERIYKISEMHGSTAVINMEAIPSTEKSVEMYQKHGENPMTKLFDNKESYQGTMKMDLNKGSIQQQQEKMSSEWIIVDPSASPDDADPSVLRMKFIQSYDIEKVN